MGAGPFARLPRGYALVNLLCFELYSRAPSPVRHGAEPSETARELDRRRVVARRAQEAEADRLLAAALVGDHDHFHLEAAPGRNRPRRRREWREKATRISRFLYSAACFDMTTTHPLSKFAR